MSFPNIFSMFSGQPQTPVAPAPAATNNPTGVANPNQALPGTHSSANTDPNGVVPANPGGNTSVTPTTESTTPLDQFKDIWQTPTTDPSQANPSMFAGLDPAKLMEAARKVDFSKAIPPDTMQKIQAGGPEAAAAFAQAMNAVSQTVFAQNAQASIKIIEQAMSKQQEQFTAQLPNLVKRHSAHESILANNPLMSNPAVQPLVGALQEQLIRKNPNASSAEIQQQVNDYFAKLGEAFGPKPASTQTNQTSNEEDWGKFFGA